MTNKALENTHYLGNYLCFVILRIDREIIKSGRDQTCKYYRYVRARRGDGGWKRDSKMVDARSRAMPSGSGNDSPAPIAQHVNETLDKQTSGNRTK